MKVLVVASIVALFAVANCKLTPEEADEYFAAYLKKYKIRLGRSDDTQRAKQNVVDRFNDVEEHNKHFAAGEVPYELAINELSYLSYEDLIRMKTGVLETNETTEAGIPYEYVPESGRGGRAAETYLNWLDTPGVVQPVQDQKACGSCWAFAGIGALEGQLALRLNITRAKLSEQEVIECARNPWAGNTLGCNGGWHFSVYDHAKDNNGVTTQIIRPYIANTYAKCNITTSRVVQAKTKSYVDIPSKNEAAMKDALTKIGPLYVTFHVSSDFYSYKSGVYTDKYGYCTSSTLNNHGVLLVGWGTQSGTDYWLVKNSWGTGFGESGYFKIQRGRNLCGISSCVNYPVLA